MPAFARINLPQGLLADRSGHRRGAAASRAARSSALAALLLLAAACTRTVPLALPAAGPVTVFGGASNAERTLEPGSPDHARLAAWLAANSGGWSPHLATRPAHGVLVRGGELDLQIVGSTALTRTRDGVFSRPIDPKDLEFLGR